MIYKPSKRYAPYVRAIMKCGHWIETGRLLGESALLEHIESGAVIGYQLHDGGNDKNSPRNWASDASRICGCQFVAPRGRKRSRKTFDPTDPEVEAQRRKYRQRAEEEAQRRAEAEERKRREEEVSELREALVHAQRSIINNPNDRTVHAHWARISHQYMQAKESL